ncbi:hypothetical protein PS880_00812 [Pseudomonas fluorescens]|uniref:Uncharacterized protein n=1 Tax=Pseudomonas fluorescens TaxID=294 RepID=A0A5E7HFM6_PSEFL|nr:hypothetical protein PS880_00812 [Pseudomonas fluorescens]
MLYCRYCNLLHAMLYCRYCNLLHAMLYCRYCNLLHAMLYCRYCNLLHAMLYCRYCNLLHAMLYCRYCNLLHAMLYCRYCNLLHAMLYCRYCNLHATLYDTYCNLQTVLYDTRHEQLNGRSNNLKPENKQPKNFQYITPKGIDNSVYTKGRWRLESNALPYRPFRGEVLLTCHHPKLINRQTIVQIKQTNECMHCTYFR